jgi:hypothetical protein
MEKLAEFAATTFGKWIIGAALPALGVFIAALVNSVGGLGLEPWVATALGSILGSIASRLGIPAPEPVVALADEPTRR